MANETKYVQVCQAVQVARRPRLVLAAADAEDVPSSIVEVLLLDVGFAVGVVVVGGGKQGTA